MHVTNRHMPSEDLQAFPLCASPSVSGSEGCHHVTLREIMIDVVIMYAVYTAIYISVVSYSTVLMMACMLYEPKGCILAIIAIIKPTSYMGVSTAI